MAQFYKELKRRGFTDRVDYRGFDIDSKFLEIGKRYFPEISDKLIEFDIESSVPPNSDIIICSACFEHLTKPYDALDNMLGSASKFIYLRTFVGTSTIEQIQSDTEFVSVPYNINQFNLFELSQFFFKKGYNFLEELNFPMLLRRCPDLVICNLEGNIVNSLHFV